MRLGETDGETGSITADEIGPPRSPTRRPHSCLFVFLLLLLPHITFASSHVRPHLHSEHFVCLLPPPSEHAPHMPPYLAAILQRD